MRARYAERWNQLDASSSAFDRAMSCADVVCVHGFRSHRLGAAVPNELVAEFVSGDPGRRAGIAGIDPLAPGAMDEVEHAIDLGMCGLSISPALQGFHPTHSEAMRIYERAADAGLPVFVTNDLPLTASAILDFARPSAFDEVARSIPQLRIVLGDVGQPWMNETLALIGKHQHVFADVSTVVSRPWELYTTLLSAASARVMDKILFGSGFPFETPTHAIESLYSVNAYSQGTQLASIPRSLIRSIVERDSLAILGIDVIASGTSNSESEHVEVDRAQSRV